MISMKKYEEKCLFADQNCPLKEIEVQGSLCQACVAQGMATLTQMMKDLQERSLKVTKLNMIFNLLNNFHNEEEAKEWFDKISNLATEWKFPWEEEP